MSADKATAVGTRVFFFTAFVLLAVAAVRFVAANLGHPIAPTIAPGRLLEFSSASAIFATALLLRQIREQISKTADS